MNDSILHKQKQRDQQFFDQAYKAPKDSIQLSGLPYERGVTAPILYSIERRKNDTRVTFFAPIYFDSQWLHFGRGSKIIDKASGDEYNVRGYDGGTPFGRLLIVQGFNRKCIFVSLIFPKLEKSVKTVDILELPHETGEGGYHVNKKKNIQLRIIYLPECECVKTLAHSHSGKYDFVYNVSCFNCSTNRSIRCSC